MKIWQEREGINIRRRILITNAFMVLLSLIILLLFSGSVIRSFSKRFINIQQNILNEDIFSVDDYLNQINLDALDWNKLSKQVAEYDYELCVFQNNKIVYSSLGETNKDILQYLKMVKWPDSKVNAYNTQGISIVGKNIEDYTVIAIYLPKARELERSRPQLEVVLLYFFIFGLSASGVIFFISQIFSYHFVKTIMIPVNALTEGAKRVEQGDLSVPVQYKGKDEFRVVCDAFNEMQLHLKEEQEKNQQYEKARNDLVSGISHDLRTPLTSIKGYIKGLQDGVAFTPEKQERYLSIAYKKACDMEVLLHRLSYFSKMESGKLPLVLKNLDLSDFVKSYVNEIGDELRHRNISVTIECSDESHVVLIDEEQMTRVITNLVENAIHYANADCLELKMQVWKEGDFEHFVFSDNGQGVTEEQLSHLFEQFWRGDESRSSRNGSGSGLGLYIVKYIIEAHGGTVQAENAKGLMIKMEIPGCKEGLHEQYSDC